MTLANVVRSFGFIAILSATATATNITIGGGNGNVYFQENPDPQNVVRSLGQTFMLPAPGTDNVLTGFSFAFPTDQVPDSGFDFQAYVFEFNTGTLLATGAALYTSAVLNAGTDLPVFTGLSVALTPGTTYIAFLTTQSVVNDGFANGYLRHVYGDGSSYTDGSSFQQNSANATSNEWTTTAWSSPGGDFVFTADFEEGPPGSTDIPEPSTFGLGLAGMLLTAAGFRRGKRTESARAK